MAWVTDILGGWAASINSTVAVVIVHKIQAALSSSRHERPLGTGLSTERIRRFGPPLGFEGNNLRAYLGVYPVVKIPRDSTGYGITS